MAAEAGFVGVDLLLVWAARLVGKKMIAANRTIVIRFKMFSSYKRV
jgi:hypothetical protein